MHDRMHAPVSAMTGAAVADVADATSDPVDMDDIYQTLSFCGREVEMGFPVPMQPAGRIPALTGPARWREALHGGR